MTNTSSAVEADTSSAVEANMSSAVEANTSSAIEANTSSPVEANTSSPVEANTSSPVEANTSSPVEANTSSPVEANTSSAIEANTSSAKEARLLPLTRSFHKQHPGTWTLANATESPMGLPLSHDQISTNPPSVLALPSNPKHLASHMDLIRDLTKLMTEDRFQGVDCPEGWTSWCLHDLGVIKDREHGKLQTVDVTIVRSRTTLPKDQEVKEPEQTSAATEIGIRGGGCTCTTCKIAARMGIRRGHRVGASRGVRRGSIGGRGKK